MCASCLNSIPFTNTISSPLPHPRVKTHGTTNNEIQFTSESSQPTTSQASVAANNSPSDCHLLSIPHTTKHKLNVACRSQTPLEATNLHHVTTCRIRMKITTSMTQHTVPTRIPQPSTPTELQHISTSLAHAAVDQIAASPCAVNIIDSVSHAFIIALINGIAGTVLLGLQPTT